MWDRARRIRGIQEELENSQPTGTPSSPRNGTVKLVRVGAPGARKFRTEGTERCEVMNRFRLGAHLDHFIDHAEIFPVVEHEVARPELSVYPPPQFDPGMQRGRLGEVGADYGLIQAPQILV